MAVYIDYDDWKPCFVLLPRISISKKILWGRCYRRICWYNAGAGPEPDYQYGNMFDVLRWA